MTKESSFLRILLTCVYGEPVQASIPDPLPTIAPNLVKAAVEGRLPRGVGIERLRNPPTEWSRQFEALGLNPE